MNRVGSARMRGFRWFGRKLFESAGFKWDLRRSGDLKIGLWRKALGSSKKLRKRFVLTPGFGDTPLSWFPVVLLLLPALRRAGFDEIVLLDFPGFNGYLRPEKCFPSIELMFDAAADVYDWLEPHTMLGHSLGGWITARYAADCGGETRPRNRRRHGYAGPEQVLLVAAGGAYESDAVRDQTEKLFHDLFGEAGFAVLRPHLFAREPLWFRWLVNDFSQFAADPGIQEFIHSIGHEHLVQGRLGDIRATTWLVWGDCDTLVPTTGFKTWLDGLTSVGSESHAILIRNVGHSPQLEKPAVTAAVVSQILMGRVPRADSVKILA